MGSQVVFRQIGETGVLQGSEDFLLPLSLEAFPTLEDLAVFLTLDCGTCPPETEYLKAETLEGETIYGREDYARVFGYWA